MKHIYGPVQSRRLGLSLGISLTPSKICSFNCIYCQLGTTLVKTAQRKEYVKIDEIFEEFKLWLASNEAQIRQLSYITLSGSGEPTLHEKISQLITEIKRLTAVPVAVITNASLLDDYSVRQAIAGADVIIPSLDAVTQPVFEKIDRPHPDIKLERVIEGLIKLRKEFKGEIWLEVMLVKGVNDDLRHIKRLREAIDKINPHKIHLNSPVRTTAEPKVFPVDKNKLKKIKEILGDKCEVI